MQEDALFWWTIRVMLMTARSTSASACRAVALAMLVMPVMRAMLLKHVPPFLLKNGGKSCRNPTKRAIQCFGSIAKLHNAMPGSRGLK